MLFESLMFKRVVSVSSLCFTRDPLPCQCLETGKLDLSGEDMAEERRRSCSLKFQNAEHPCLVAFRGHAVSCNMLRGRRCWPAAQLYVAMLR